MAYNPNRSSDWNYGGKKWRLSRSKIDLFIECPRCFYLNNKLGTARPRGPAFTINIAVDTLFKKEFDIYRAKKESHPLMTQNSIKAIPYEHKDMDIWRENFKGLQFTHKPTGFIVSGAVDDIWQNERGELIVVDYKSTSKKGRIESLSDSSWEDQYKRQIGVYQWLLLQNNFPVSKTGYFVYANARAEEDVFDGKLKFEITVVPCDGQTEWIEPTLEKIKKCLESNNIPISGNNCEFCSYREASGKKLQKMYLDQGRTKQKRQRKDVCRESLSDTPTLF